MWFDQNVTWLSALCALVRGDLTKLMRGSLVALITIDVHNRDIIEYLINEEATSKQDFTWQMRIRYYWNSSRGPVALAAACRRWMPCLALAPCCRL